MCLRENEVAILRRAKKIYGEGNVQYGQEEYRKADKHVGIEGSSK